MRYFFCLFLLLGIVNLSGCSPVTDQIIEAGNFLGRQEGLVGSEESYSQEEQRKHILEMISPEQEYFIGRAVAAQILKRFPEYSDPGLQKYIELIGNALIVNDGGGSPFGGYHFKVIVSDQFNAISAPGGYIFITTGFLKALGNEDQIAAILAHEITHTNLRHGITALKDNSLLAEISGLGMAAGGFNCVEALSQATVIFSHLVDGLVDTLLESGYSQEFEYQADEGAYKRLLVSRYQGKAIFGAIEVLRGPSSESSEAEGGWFSTHPSVNERVDKLQILAAASPQVELPSNGFDLRTQRAHEFLKGL